MLGIEKESLRVTENGVISQADHPRALGAALTHPAVTTDYSEALLEFVTAPHESVSGALTELENLHRWVFSHLESERFWVASMPCILAGENSIRIAGYGASNEGLMKTVYRRGLGLRYGRMMQVIAGVHFNYSFSDPMMRQLHQLFGHDSDFATFKSEAYMGMVRNLLRLGWVVPYLFGASPAICESFLKGQPTTLEYLGQGTYFESFATSLRLGDIGYQNSREGETGVDIDFNSMSRYVDSLEQAIETPCPRYAAMGVVERGVHKQLNANRLQIENEYYCSVRPKTLLQGLEKPVHAMRNRGIDYVELRSVDLNPFEPLGVSERQLYFLEALMVYAMLLPSPPMQTQEKQIVAENLALVAHCGRDPALEILRGERKIALRRWASEIFEHMRLICSWLDAKAPQGHEYTQSLDYQIQKNAGVVDLPATRMMKLLRENKESFHQFANRKAALVGEYFAQHPLPAEQQMYYEQLAQESRLLAQDMTRRPQPSFTEFLAHYFAQ